MTLPADRWVAVGRIGRPQGRDGAVRVHPFNADTQVLFSVTRVAVGDSEATAQPGRVREVCRRPKYVSLRLRECSTPEGARRLTGRQLFVRRGDFPPLEAGEHYCCDLIGLNVETSDGTPLGVLAGILPTASNDVYVVRSGRSELLLPALASVVRSIDPARGKIVADPPEAVDAL